MKEFSEYNVWSEDFVSYRLCAVRQTQRLELIGLRKPQLAVENEAVDSSSSILHRRGDAAQWKEG